jgi:hypothetical protein
VPPASRVRQPSLIEGIALDQMSPQHFRGPDAELGTAPRLYAVADENDDVEAVRGNRLVGGGNVQILHIAVPGQRVLARHIVNVLRDDRSLTTAQLTYLRLGQPDGVMVQAHVQPDLAIGCLVEDDLATRVLPLRSSDQRLEIGSHHALHAANGGILLKFSHRETSRAPSLTQRFERHVEADLWRNLKQSATVLGTFVRCIGEPSIVRRSTPARSSSSAKRTTRSGG